MGPGGVRRRTVLLQERRSSSLANGNARRSCPRQPQSTYIACRYYSSREKIRSVGSDLRSRWHIPHVERWPSSLNYFTAMHDPLITLVMRSYNEAWALRDTLPALRAQDYVHWELIVFDSGSSDGSVELIRAAQPQHFIQLLPHDYNPSRVMNHAMELARTEIVIFLNADATPQGPQWLRPLVGALQN